MYTFTLIVFALFGLIFGSFGNVVIWRLPRKESLSFPPSHCPQCDTTLKPFDNIPVISYLFLGGKCRYCKNPIATRYPLVELFSAAVFAFAFILSTNLLQAVSFAIFFYLLLILTFIDIDTQRLPNKIVGLLGIVGIAGVALSYTPSTFIDMLTIAGQRLPITATSTHNVLPGLASSAASSALLDGLYGILLGAGPAALFASLYYFVRKRAGFGMGDIKLLVIMGPFLGTYNALTLPLSAFLALTVLTIQRFRNADVSLTHRFAFGPYLALGSVLVLVWGAPFWNWYLSLLV